MDLEAPLQKPEMETKWTTKLCKTHSQTKWNEQKQRQNPGKSSHKANQDTIIHSYMEQAHGKWPMSCANWVMLQHFETFYFDETLTYVTDNALKEESLQIWNAKNEGGSIWNIHMFANLRQNIITAKMHFLNFRLVISLSVCKIHLIILL